MLVCHTSCLLNLAKYFSLCFLVVSTNTLVTSVLGMVANDVSLKSKTIGFVRIFRGCPLIWIL